MTDYSKLSLSELKKEANSQKECNMKKTIRIATPTCQACKHFKEKKSQHDQSCFHPNRPQGNDSPEPYMINCHGIGFEWGDWNNLSVEIEVDESVANQIYSKTRYRELDSPHTRSH